MGSKGVFLSVYLISKAPGKKHFTVSTNKNVKQMFFNIINDKKIKNKSFLSSKSAY